MFVRPQRVAAPWSDGNWWGQYTEAALLPNMAGAEIQLPDVQPGDLAYAVDTPGLYECIDPTVGAAVWGLIPLAATAGGLASPLVFGVQNVFTTLTVRYLAPGGNNVNTSASVLPLTIAAPRAGVLSQMRVIHNFPIGGPNSVTYTLRVNGAVTALSLTLAANVVAGSDLIDTVTVAAGDRLDIQVTKTLALGSGQLFPTLSMRYD